MVCVLPGSHYIFAHDLSITVFDALFGSAGLLKNRAVLLVTHNIKLLEHAHHIIVLNSGKVLYQGTLPEITRSGYDLASGLALGAIGQEGMSKVVIEPGEEHVEEQEVAEPAIAKESLGFTPYMFWARNASWIQAVLAVVCVFLPSRMLSGLTAVPQTLILFGGLVRIASQALLRAWADARGERQGQWIGGYAGLTAALLIVKYVGLRIVFLS